MGHLPGQSQDKGQGRHPARRSGARPGYSPPPGLPGQRRSAPGRSRGQRGSRVPRGERLQGRAVACMPGRPARPRPARWRRGWRSAARPVIRAATLRASRSPHALKFVTAWLAMRCSINARGPLRRQETGGPHDRRVVALAVSTIGEDVQKSVDTPSVARDSQGQQCAASLRVSVLPGYQPTCLGHARSMWPESSYSRHRGDADLRHFESSARSDHPGRAE